MFSRYNLKIVESYVFYNDIKNGCGNEKCFSISNSSKYAIDIGGTLIKLVYTIKLENQIMLKEEEEFFYKCFNCINLNDCVKDESVDISFPSLILFCLIPENDLSAILQLENIFGFLVERGLYVINEIVPMTGGGSIKYKTIIESKYNISISHIDEISGIVMGYFKLFENKIINKIFNYTVYCEKKEINMINNSIISHSILLPTLIVSVGSGISIIKVETKNKFERIGGTRFGGGIVYGLGKLLGINSYDELLSIYKKMNDIENNTEDSFKNENCYFKEILFSSLNNSNLKIKEKVINDIINMMYTDLSYLLCLLLLKHEIRNIVFCGNNVSNNYNIILKSLKKCSNFLIEDNINIFFHRLDGFFGAIGAYFI
ncbi:hypothetical protein FG386_001095 [Cryptosporidium ryanae]|uniref:uncharacterized protein n=1 Tax=Cryptosporidium ryanae TaxID=515981 RepID=UPI003519DF58|nr:hypothetical protein FG386_001095 [Cryptosporidium ryanae]